MFVSFDHPLKAVDTTCRLLGRESAGDKKLLICSVIPYKKYVKRRIARVVQILWFVPSSCVFFHPHLKGLHICNKCLIDILVAIYLRKNLITPCRTGSQWLEIGYPTHILTVYNHISGNFDINNYIWGTLPSHIRGCPGPQIPWRK